MSKSLNAKTLIAAALFATATIAGCGDSQQFVFTNTGNEVSEEVSRPPLAVDDNIAALGNATLNQSAANGVLSNDTLNGASITAFDAMGSQGGTIELNQDGSFSYTPALDYVGPETFDYTLSNEDGSSTATVTLTSTGLGRFVDNSAPDNGTGTQADPFDNVASAVAVAQPGDTIFVARGDGTDSGMTGGFDLPAGVDLIGEGTGLILAQTVVEAGLAPTLEGPINCLGDNVIQGVTVDGSVDDLIVVDGAGNVSIQDCTLSNPTNNHVSIVNGSGSLTVLRSTFDLPASNQDYIEIDNANTNATVNVSNNFFFNQATLSVQALLNIEPTGTSQIDAVFNGNEAVEAATASFNYGFYLDNQGTGSCTFQVDGNSFENFDQTDGYPIGTFATNGPVSGNISNNTIDNSGFAGILASVEDGDIITITGNRIDSGQYGVYGYFEGDGTFVVADNPLIQNSSQVGVYCETFGPAPQSGRIAVRNNVLASNTEAFYAATIAAGHQICVDLTGNDIDSNVRFNGSNAGVVNVERLQAPDGPLSAVNTFAPGVMVDEVNPTVNPLDAGDCLIP